MDNLFKNLHDQDTGDFRWLYPPKTYRFEDGALYVSPEDKSDLFFSPIDPIDRFNAAVLIKKVTGNFISVIKCEPNFCGRANAAGIFGYVNEKTWTKLCFEKFGPQGLVPCAMVTTTRSDDANGAFLTSEPKALWMKFCRNGQAFSMFYSEDGTQYTFLRKFALPDAPETIEVGIFAQCPDCESVEHKINCFSVENVDAVNIRTGEPM